MKGITKLNQYRLTLICFGTNLAAAGFFPDFDDLASFSVSDQGKSGLLIKG